MAAGKKGPLPSSRFSSRLISRTLNLGDHLSAIGITPILHGTIFHIHFDFLDTFHLPKGCFDLGGTMLAIYPLGRLIPRWYLFHPVAFADQPAVL
jgi:hypothetical protein